MHWHAHILNTPGRPWTDVVTNVDGAWVCDDPVALAALGSSFLSQVATVHGWTAIPLPGAARHSRQLQILLLAQSAAARRSIDLILYELYAVPTHLIWQIEAP